MAIDDHLPVLPGWRGMGRVEDRQMIVDGHAHLTSEGPGRLELLLQQLDQAGIDRCLCVPGGMIDVRRFDQYLAGKLQPLADIPNELVYDALANYGDRLYGLVCVNPHQGPDCLFVLEDGFRQGCRGVKLAPMVHRLTFDMPVLDDVARACGERGFPVYSHVVPAPGASTGDYANYARRHPQTNFILGHMGFGPFDSAAIEYAADLPNFYLETSLGNYLALAVAVERAGPEKLIFGSEFPLGHPRAELENVRLLPAASQQAILSGNILHLLGVG
jgi:hypothetical protein